MPLSPIYPPRDRSKDVYTPPSELKRAVVEGFVYFGLGALFALMSRSLRRSATYWVLATGCWVNAYAIKAGLSKGRRWGILAAWVAAIGAVAWVTAD